MSIIDRIKGHVSIFVGGDILGLDIPHRDRQSVFLCPFPDHEDTHPSAMLYPHSDRIWCFGCNRGGDILDITQIVRGGDINDAIDFWKRRLNIEDGEPIDYAEIAKRKERQIVQGAYRTWRRESEQLLPKPTIETIWLFDGVWLEKDRIDAEYGEVSTKDGLKEYIGELTEWLRWGKKVVGDEDGKD